jgi:hypothetical protein
MRYVCWSDAMRDHVAAWRSRTVILNDSRFDMPTKSPMSSLTFWDTNWKRPSRRKLLLGLMSAAPSFYRDLSTFWGHHLVETVPCMRRSGTKNVHGRLFERFGGRYERNSLDHPRTKSTPAKPNNDKTQQYQLAILHSKTHVFTYTTHNHASIIRSRSPLHFPGQCRH